MRAKVRGYLAARPKLYRLVRIFAFGLVGAGLSGCATQQAPQYAGVYQPAAERSWKADVEDDGRPAQAPPIRRMRPEEDDPSQPWSPNYGRGKSRDAAPHSPQPPAQLTRPALIDTSAQGDALPLRHRALSAAEADTVILRAIQNHETRKP